MSFKFSEQQLLNIEAAVAVVVNTPGANWFGAYHAVVIALDEADEQGLIAEEDMLYVDAVAVWFRGALLVNSGEGAFSALIRQFTLRELHLHFGSGNYNEADVVELKNNRGQTTIKYSFMPQNL